jgi:ubiquinone/menaquinone biosynthesis C-methylase UbiE
MQKHRKAYKGLAMEGMLATWYAQNTARNLAEFAALAQRIAGRVAPGARILEVAPGPGYLAIAVARLGRYDVAGVDISRSFVQMAGENAARAGVAVDFQYGDAAALPLTADRFDFVVCRAAFKNFADPVGALREMHRVLKAGGEALIIDMRNDASNEAIDRAVNDMKLGRLDSLITKVIMKHGLRRKAYSRSQFLDMVQQTPFGHADIDESPIGFEIGLRKEAIRSTKASAA